MSGRAATQANRGTPFEELLEMQHSVYRARGVAHIVKVPTEIVVHGPRVGGTWAGAHAARKSTTDYLGVVTAGENHGRAVAIEAKSTSQDRWSPSVTPDHQREELARWHAMGALAAVLLLWDVPGAGDRVCCWAVPWPAVEVRLRARRSWKVERAEGGVRVVGAGIGPVDYLAALGVPTAAVR